MDRPEGDNRRPRLINRRQQGDLGEASAIEWLTSVGAIVFIPFGHSPDVDLVAEAHGRLLRIQVKTSTQFVPCDGGRRRMVSLATRGGNRSWSGLTRRFDASRFDFLFVLTGDGRRWFIPSHAIEAETSIALGGTKYSEFEIEVGRNIEALVYGSLLESDEPAGEYPSGQRMAPVKRPAQPSQVRILPPPLPSKDIGTGPAPCDTGARTTLSKKHQVTIPMSQFRAAELRAGDRFRVMATGPGRVELTRVDELVGRHALESSVS
jgi:PD-(D/E)XK endonuclease